MSRVYAIASPTEARAYLCHPVLGRRLIECAQILTDLSNLTAESIFGATDATKLRSSMTLFAAAAAAAAATADDDAAARLFKGVLADYFDGDPDPATAARLVRA